MNSATGKTSSVFLRVWRDYLQRRALLVFIAALFMLVDGGALGLLAWYIKPLIDEVLVAANRDAIVPVAGAIFLIFSARAVAAFVQRSLTASVGLRVIADMQQNLSQHLMTLDGRFFHLHSPGTLLERVRGDTQTLQQISTNALISIGRDSFTLISLLIAALLIDWRWTLAALIGLPLLAAPMNLLHKLVRRSTLRSRRAADGLSERLDEMFHGIKAIKANRMEQHETERASEQIHEFRRRTLQAEMGKAAQPSLVDLIAGLGFVLVMLYGASQIADGEKTLGDFMAFFSALALLFDPVRRLANVGAQLQAAKVSLERIYQLLDERPMIVDQPGAQPLSAAGDIHFDQVTFGYSQDKKVLDGISFCAPCGQVTAIVGPSGAGKSTLFNLICRFEEAQAGQLCIGDQDIRSLTMNSLRDNLALVTQETALFDESIYQNIACGRPGASEQEVMEAAQMALVTEFIGDLPEGIHSPCGPRGSNLSGGQRQRVVIARALLRNAPILLLDEATAALDSRTEQRIQAAIEQAMEGKTCLVIAHRLSTVQRADQILVLNEGRVVEQGSHNELMQASGLYRAMASGLASESN